MKKNFSLLFSCTLFLSLCSFSQGSVSATYTTGDIPTSFNVFDPSCNGNNIILSVTLPAGDSYTVTGMDISYSMTALGSGQMADQRSRVKCVNNNTTEASVFSGAGAAAGTFNYSRTTVTIANGTYPGGTRLDFEMHAWRTVEVTPGCNTTVNRVNAGSWTLIVYYAAQNIVPKIGVNNTTPATTFDINGKLKLGNDVTAPQAGMIRWNSNTNDFEGYNGSRWLSLTNKDASAGWGSGISTQENQGLVQSADTADYFGYSVSISGDYAIVGAYAKDVGVNADQGRAYIYIRNGSGSPWISQATLTASDGAAFDNFGISVSISSDYAIVGAGSKNIGANSQQGRAYIFNRSGTVWNQQAILTASDGAAFDRFGASVSISGDYAIVGANEKNIGANTSQGKAYIFYRNGVVWSQQAMFTSSDGAAGDDFGASVSISGDYAVVGANNKDVGVNTNQGKVYVFSRSGILWNEQAMLTASDGAANAILDLV